MDFISVQKWKSYTDHVRSAMVYGSVTWISKADDMYRLEQSEMPTVKWMCNVSPKARNHVQN